MRIFKGRISKTSLFILGCTLTLAVALLLPSIPFKGVMHDTGHDTSKDISANMSVISTGNEEEELNNLPDLKVYDIRIYGEKGRFIKNMNNKVSVIVSNDGNTYARNIKVALYIKRGNLVYVSNEEIAYLGRGEKREVEMTLFSPTLNEAAVALLKFAGLEQIVVKVDPYNKIEESNEENNVAYKQVSYEDIFPRFSKLEEKIINLVEGKGYDQSFIKKLVTKLAESNKGNITSSIESLLS